jgi:phosphomannomutase
MVKDQYPLSLGTETGGGEASARRFTSVAAVWDRIVAEFPEARADRRDGLRLDWDDCWVHVRASNTEPIVRVIAEAARPTEARALADRIGKWVTVLPEGRP